MLTNVADIRRDYILQKLVETEVDATAMKQFDKWWQEAVNSAIDEVNAFTLATVSPEGKPSARIVLLKGFDEEGFVFFTNYNSRKGAELQNNPHVGLVFFWKELERQVRIEGQAEKLDSNLSDSYFSSRPEGSRIGAWASPQSSVIESRELIEENAIRYKQMFEGRAIPRPDHWGGYLVRPDIIEFWQGRSSRLHDRLRYTKQAPGTWDIKRLAP
jgi:pyridoxamine 5'-phosphate oxidase